MNRPIFCFVGLSGSGKTTLLNGVMNYFRKFSNRNYKKLIYHTTRKKRPNEVDGEDYIFETDVTKMENIVEIRTYNKADEGVVYYYTTYDDASDESVDAYLCAASVNQVYEYVDKFDNVRIIALDCPAKDRIKRSLNRVIDKSRIISDSQCEEICRRVLEEKEEYANLKEINVDLIWNIDSSDASDLDLNIIKVAHYIEDMLEEGF